jgi:hypothetical protein
MRATTEMVTPKKAMEWLKRNIHNRPFSKIHVGYLVALLRDGKYKLNGEAIKFNSNGDLIDGQHRLMACVESGVSFQSLIVRGLEHEAFDTLDGGRPRSAADVLARHGEKNCNTLAAACRAVFLIEKYGVFNEVKSVRRDQIADALAATPGLRASTDFAMATRTNLIGRSIVAALHYLFSQKDARAADAFWEHVLKGEGLTAGMPEYRLRERLIKEKAAMGRLRAPDAYALAIKAWNFRRDGQACKQLKLGPDEDFPKIK